LKLEVFGGRNGKVNIQNELIRKYGNLDATTVLVLTDANVFFEKHTLFNLGRHFRNEEIGMVGANVLNLGVQETGISTQEKTYVQRENEIKYHEGLIWGSMMGAFGACYAIRGNLFQPVPSNFIVDDFYLTMHVLRAEKQAIMALDAICHEDVSDEMQQEFKRKIRISTGNFQNLKLFAHLIWPPWNGRGFSFFSHKVLRWKGPVFLILAWTCSGILASTNPLYFGLFIVQTALFFVPLCDFLFRQIGLHIKPLRFIAYFYYMNLALFIGLLKFIKGVKSNVWEPTKRNQS